METIVEQFNRFDGGLHSELRAEYETPRFARTWNFDVSHDRLIQNGGWVQFCSEPGHIVQGRVGYPSGNKIIPSAYQDGSQNAQNFINMFGLAYSGNGKQIASECNPIPFDFIAPAGVHSGTVPIVHNKSVIYKGKDGVTYVDPFGGGSSNSFSVLARPGGGSLTDQPDTFYVEGADNNVYTFSGNKMYSFQVALNAGGPGPYQFYGSDIAKGNITQFMQLNDRNGQPATYTIGGVVMPYVINEVAILQDRLRELNYNPGPSDGFYGLQTENAVKSFQTDHQATGTVNGGQTAGSPLAVDGIIGPETRASINLPLYSSFKYKQQNTPILEMPSNITAVSAVGGYIAFATAEDDGNAHVYLWDLTRDKNGRGEIGLKTFIDVGQGVIQCLDVLDGDLIAIMSPFTLDTCSACYDKLKFYKIHTSFERYPESYAELIAEYRLKSSPDNDNSSIEYGRYNTVNQKTVIYGSRMYFSANLHFQKNDIWFNDDEGIMCGVFSINSKGYLLFHASVPKNQLTDYYVGSFGLMNNGFVISCEDDSTGSNGKMFYTASGIQQTSGLITKIINGKQPWRNKQIENIYLAIDNESGLDNIEIYTREVMNKNNADSGWVKVYDAKTSEEKRTFFRNRVHINRNTMDMSKFDFFRELQVMVKIYGSCVELVDLTIVYNMLDLNK